MSLVRKAISIAANNGHDWLRAMAPPYQDQQAHEIPPSWCRLLPDTYAGLPNQNLSNHHHHNSNNFRYTAGVNFVFGNEK